MRSASQLRRLGNYQMPAAWYLPLAERARAYRDTTGRADISCMQCGEHPAPEGAFFCSAPCFRVYLRDHPP